MFGFLEDFLGSDDCDCNPYDDGCGCDDDKDGGSDDGGGFWDWLSGDD